MNFRSNKKTHSSEQKRKLFELLLKDGDIEMPIVPRLPKRDASGPCVLSALQERLWHEWRSGRTEVADTEAILLRFSGSLNIAALIQVLDEVVRRHEILRTRFVEIDGRVSQSAAAELKLEVPIADLSHNPLAGRGVEGRLLHEHMRLVFDLDQLPLMRETVIALSPQERLLVLILHKAICDGWSKNILVDELSRCYSEYVTGNDPGLDEPEMQYCDFAQWQRSRLEAGEMDRDIEYWSDKLQRVLPAIWMARRPPEATGQSSCEIRLSRNVSDAIRQIGRNESVTPYIFLLAGWLLLLARYTGRKEVAVGTVMANRGRVELQSLIGPVSNTVPIGIDMSGDPTFRQAMARVRDVAIDALQHQELPSEWISIGREGARPDSRRWTPDVMFVMEERLVEGSEFKGLNVNEVKSDRRVADADLVMVVRQGYEAFEGRIEYNTALFDTESTMRLATGYERLITAVVLDLDCHYESYPLFD